MHWDGSRIKEGGRLQNGEAWMDLECEALWYVDLDIFESAKVQVGY